MVGASISGDAKVKLDGGSVLSRPDFMTRKAFTSVEILISERTIKL